MMMKDAVSRREFKRVKLSEPIPSSIKMVSSPFNSDHEAYNDVFMYVINIGAGGLGFVSKTEFEINYLTIYKICFTLNQKDLVLFGKIIRKRKLVNGFFEYGVKFDFSFEGWER